MSYSLENNKELKILQVNKDDLISILSSFELEKFSGKLLRSMIISVETNDAFNSLDHIRMHTMLRVRYLFQNICEGIKHDILAFNRFLYVLADFGGESAGQLSKRLKRELRLFGRKARSERQDSEEEGSSKVMADINLSEDDVPILMKTLVEVSDKWEEIGIALCLPRLIIKECRSGRDTDSLRNILREWISCNKKEITLKKLKLALESQLVGRSSFAPSMEEKFREAKSTKVPVEKMGGGDQASDEAGNSETEVCAKQSLTFGEIYLCDEDVSILSELLVECAHKWNHIGISLGLPYSKINAMEAKCLNSEADVLCLRDILFEWLSNPCQYSHGATMKKLKLSLESQLVGLPTIVNHLEEKFMKIRRQDILSVVMSAASPAKRPCLDLTLEIIHQPRDVEVTDGKSTLLDVQVNLYGSVSYEWMKDGHSLSDDLEYSGTCSDILAVRFASQGSEGEFTCRISDGSEEVISNVIVLTVIFPPEKKCLMNLYSKRREIPRDLWPVINTNTFINLALFQKKLLGYDDHSYSVEGNADHILETKVEVNYEEVFGKFEKETLLVVEGRPGCGKTTLIHKVTRDWAIRGDVLKNAKLVFHIPLRSVAKGKDKDLSDILEIFYQSKEEREKVFSGIEVSQGKGVCFIFDGLDEYHPEDRNKSVIFDLLNRACLPSAMIIVTFCPLAATLLTRKSLIDRRIEVLGFTKQRIFEYIDNFPFTSVESSSPSNLKAYLDSHLNVLHMCYLPAHVAMICFLYKHDGIPHTETEIYEHLTRFFVLRKLRCRDKKALLHSLEDIRGKNLDLFRKICHLAFDMTIHSKQVIFRRATEVHLSPTPSSHTPPTFGLITTASEASLYGNDHTYCFLHLTFQNYLAAFYIAKLDEDEQMEMIKLYAGEQHMFMVWKFLCGIVKFEGKDVQLLQIMRSADSLHRVQYAFESQQRVVCDSVLEFGRTSVLDFHLCTLTPADLTAVGYVISNTSYRVTKLVMKGCDLHGDHVRTFMSEVRNNKLMYMQTLDLSCNNIGAEGAAALADGLKYCHDLQTLHLSDSNIGTEGAAALADGLKYCHDLKTLHLSDSSIGAEGAEALANLKCHIHYD